MQGRRPPATPGRHLAADAAITSRPGRSSKRHLASVPRTALDAVPRSCGSRAGKEGGATFSPQRSQRFFLRQNPEWPGRPPDPSLLLAHLETGLRTVTELCGPQAGEQHGLPGDIAEGCSEAAEVGVGRTGCLQGAKLPRGLATSACGTRRACPRGRRETSHDAVALIS